MSDGHFRNAAEIRRIGIVDDLIRVRVYRRRYLFTAFSSYAGKRFGGIVRIRAGRRLNFGKLEVPFVGVGFILQAVEQCGILKRS